MKNRIVVRLFSVCIAAVLAFSDVTSTAFCDEIEQNILAGTDAEAQKIEEIQDEPVDEITDEDNTENTDEEIVETSGEGTVEEADATITEEIDEDLVEELDENSEEDIEDLAEEIVEDINEEIDEEPIEDISDDDSDEIEVIYGVGPAYVGIYSEEDVRKVIDEKYGDPAENFSEVESLGARYSSVSDAGKYLRGLMVKRAEKASFTSPKALDFDSLIESAMVETDKPTEGDYLRANLFGWGARMSWSGGDYSYNITFEYMDTAEQEKEVDAKVESILSEYGLNSDEKNDYEKVRIIHDYLCNNIVYTDTGELLCHSSYAALILGRCVCQGYAGAFYRLCEESGIDARYITGTAECHAWNICCVGRYYYNIDVTWDDQYIIYDDYFLKNDDDFSNKGFAGIGNHLRDPEYKSATFMQKYPMSEYSYDNRPAAADNIKLKLFLSQDSTVPEKTYTKDADITMNYGEKFYLDVRAVPNKKASEDLNFTDRVNVTVGGDGADTGSFYDPLTGYMSADKVGKTKLTFASEYSPDCKLNLAVEVKPVHISSIALNKNSTELNVGSSENLKATILPQITSDDRNIVWTSSDSNVVSVDFNGKITAVGRGTAIITATTSNNLKATCKVITSQAVSSIYIADGTTGERLQVDEERTICVGETIVLKAVAEPYNADYLKGISWDYYKGDTSNPDTGILTKSTDNSGLNVTLTGKETGKVTVTLKMAGKEARCYITVEKPKITYYLQGGHIGDNNSVSITQEYTYGQPVGEMPIPEMSGDAIFIGWYSMESGISEKIESDTIVRKSLNVYAHWASNTDENMWIASIAPITYTGKAVKPEVKVYDGKTLLQPNKDYTITYKNNTKAYALSWSDIDFDAKKAPSVTIKGKGNYADTLTEYFEILSKDINDPLVTFDANALVKPTNGKTQYLVPTIKMGTITLKKGTDYTLEYPDTVDGAYNKPGRYNIVVKAKEGGNFTGSRTIMMTITRSDLKSIAKCSITKIADQNCATYERNEAGIGIIKVPTGTPIRPTITVKDGKNILTEGVDYTVTYFDNIFPGTARAVIFGKGNYNYSKTVTFKIKGIALDKNIVSLEKSYAYTGSQIRPVENHSNLFSVSYLKNIDAGTATLTLTGAGVYTGTVKKTFKITPKTYFEVFGVADQTYVKGGCTPKPDVYFESMKLTEGKDYTLSYANNKVVSDTTGKKKPTFTVTGKGNFKGAKVAKEFVIKAKPISQCNIFVPNVMAQPNKSNVYKPKFVVKDTNGQELKAGTDYDSKQIDYVYLDTTNVQVKVGKELMSVTRNANETVDAKDIIPSNTRLGVRIKGINNYDGLLGGESGGYAEYMITAYDISKAKAVIKDQTYTGKTVTLNKSDIVLTLPGNTEPIPTECYEIMSYTKNDKVGTATVTIKGLAGGKSGGKGDYAGTKSIKFKIKGKSILANLFG